MPFLVDHILNTGKFFRLPFRSDAIPPQSCVAFLEKVRLASSQEVWNIELEGIPLWKMALEVAPAFVVG
jgi:hypothetical protein